MSNRAFHKKVYWIVVCVTILWIMSLISVAGAQPKTHTVVKGDTLWGICEKYYGDPNLWPTLWELNPFVTNPHLLHPGDLITLFEAKPEKKEPEKVAAVPKKPEKRLPQGIDISVRTNPDAMGFFSLGKVESWGAIMASRNGRDLQYKGDTVYLKFADNVKVEPGDEFTVFKTSDLLKNPLNKYEDMGYVIRFKGRVIVEQFVGLAVRKGEPYIKPQIYQARVVDSYQPLRIGYDLAPYNRVSPCVKPVHLFKDMLGNIVGAKDETRVIGADSVVYIDKGFNQGVQRGHILQIVKTQILPDPDPDRETTMHGPVSLIVLPDIPVGILMIVESRPDSSIGVVIRSDENIKRGYWVKTLYWDEIPAVLQRLRRCDLE